MLIDLKYWITTRSYSICTLVIKIRQERNWFGQYKTYIDILYQVESLKSEIFVGALIIGICDIKRIFRRKKVIVSCLFLQPSKTQVSNLFVQDNLIALGRTWRFCFVWGHGQLDHDRYCLIHKKYRPWPELLPATTNKSFFFKA